MEIETLQTDIQRFVAILGFCLMAIFALVQAIPVTQTEYNLVIEDLAHKLAEQKAALDRLRSENQILKQEIEEVKKEAGVSRSLAKALDEADKKLDRQEKMIAKLLSEKMAQQKDQAAFKRRLEKRDRIIRKLEREKRAVQKKLKEANEILKRPVRVKLREKEKKKEPQGIYVAFESDGVFMDLLNEGRIHLFIRIMDADQIFQVLRSRREIDFKLANPDKGLDLWQVGENMVPSPLLDAFRNWTTLATRKKMLIVGLTPEISRQIRRRKVSKGRFIIRSGGKVTYSEGG